MIIMIKIMIIFDNNDNNNESLSPVDCKIIFIAYKKLNFYIKL